MINAWLEQHAAVISLVILFMMLLGFSRDRAPPSAIAVIGAAAFMLLGYVGEKDALSVFSNGAVIAIASMLILTAALVRTGVLEALASRVLAVAKMNPTVAIIMLLLIAVISSAFVNSTPVVVILIPLMVSLAASIKISSKRLLIPLSYMAILGGTCTLIGTSTNLVVNSIAKSLGHPGFGIFDITVVGVFVAVVGGVSLLLMSRFLLPKSAPGSDQQTPTQANIITEVRVCEKFSGLGEPYDDVTVLKPRGINVLGLFRSGARIARDNKSQVSAKDHWILRTTASELATLVARKNLDLGVRVRSRPARDSELQIERFTVLSESRIVGRRLSEAHFLSRFPVSIIGVRRNRNLAGPDLNSLVVHAGDQLWVEGSTVSLQGVARDPFLAQSSRPVEKPFLRERATIALATLLAVITASAFSWASLPVAAIIGIGVLLAVKSLESSDAWAALNAEVLILIYGMLIVGLGLQNTGAVDLIITLIMPWMQIASPFVVLLIIYSLTSLLTEMVTNNAVAVVMTPLAIKLGEQLGTDPTALIVAVMFGASASFATPVGYQTNTLVHVAGNYRFVEFLKIGVPMNVIVGIASCLAINVWFGA
ncbi:SLC13 family permease [Granulosicoccus antarcticus]|uniref:Putative transporter n=1 Tax=Granulosicoccus antarcticus IMCC3135 TaxID=1192854 RepID=A0A2Z2NM35_9GAMM|nr:SLC13 family permease [Granulosicoccus antarcticus]ASJ70838.1 putative transporter [Granulosicoccus antarcticus IMCC3135]